jgi:hypothetical protein
MEPKLSASNHSLCFSVPVTDLIQRRFSCRSYLKKPIAPEIQERLENFAAGQRVGPLGGTARFELVAGKDKDLAELKGLGTYGFIKGATGFIVGAVSADGSSLEDFGFLLEKIILYATDLGLGTCWLGGTFTKTSFAKKINVGESELVPSVSAAGYIAGKPRRIDKLIRRGANADKRLPWDRLFLKGDFEQPLVSEQAGDYAAALEMVRLGPSASNRQPWRIVNQDEKWHFYLQRSAGYQERSLNKLYTNADLQRIDMGIAMCHFELTLREQEMSGRWIVDDPGISNGEALIEYTATWVV